MPIYIVATPIGNLEDMTYRAIRTLREADAIASEDTRHTGRLLKHFDIDTPQISYHDRNRHQRTRELVDRATNGETIALVCDAGVPGISDPGYELVCACIEANIDVIPIPGANAVVTALSASGLPPQPFIFEGFLATKGKERQQQLQRLQTETRTIVLYEAPHRLVQTLENLQEKLGSDRAIVIARELTKLHEQFWRGTIASAREYYKGETPRGEFTLVIAGATIELPNPSDEEILTEIQQLMAAGQSRSQASRTLAASTNRSRQQIYRLTLSLEGGETSR